jgi:hypothetical protein
LVGFGLLYEFVPQSSILTLLSPVSHFHRFVLPTHKSRQIATRIHCVPSRKRYCSDEIRRSNSGADKDSRLLECYPVSTGNQLSIFRSSVVPPSSGPNSP